MRSAGGRIFPVVSIPVKVNLKTDYSGVRAEVGFNYLAGSSRTRPNNGDWLIRFGLGLDSWRRGLRDGRAEDSTPVSGYSEHYIVSYATVAGQYLGHGWRGGLGIMAPYYVDEEVSLLSDKLHPVGQLSPFANAEFFIERHWSLLLQYTTYRFAKSDVSGGYYQPKSSRDSYFASVRYHF